ncbi:hypothetical protein ABC255_09490 [Neobacillus sp. 3P2-tot-E-2]|uniref:hypothetical protein n=1 Tax=Neobacillus sp. 3P2-tot-E-2 TaxID=3132212 RepID=UPI0039A18450
MELGAKNAVDTSEITIFFLTVHAKNTVEGTVLTLFADFQYQNSENYKILYLKML